MASARCLPCLLCTGVQKELQESKRDCSLLAVLPVLGQSVLVGLPVLNPLNHLSCTTVNTWACPKAEGGSYLSQGQELETADLSHSDGNPSCSCQY